MKKAEPTGVNKSKLNKGVVKIALGIFMMFLGPVVISSAFNNAKHPMFYPVLILAIATCIYACILFLSGLRTFVKGIFND